MKYHNHVWTVNIAISIILENENLDLPDLYIKGFLFIRESLAL